MTAMTTVAHPAGRQAHDAYLVFVRDGAWSLPRLWQVLTVHPVDRLRPTGFGRAGL